MSVWNFFAMYTTSNAFWSCELCFSVRYETGLLLKIFIKFEWGIREENLLDSHLSPETSQINFKIFNILSNFTVEFFWGICRNYVTSSYWSSVQGSSSNVRIRENNNKKKTQTKVEQNTKSECHEDNNVWCEICREI